MKGFTNSRNIAKNPTILPIKILSSNFLFLMLAGKRKAIAIINTNVAI